MKKLLTSSADGYLFRASIVHQSDKEVISIFTYIL